MNFGLGEISVFIVGIVYGYINSDNQKRVNLLKKALIYGFTTGIIVGILRSLSLYYTITLGIIVSIVLVISTFIGSLLKEKLKNK